MAILDPVKPNILSAQLIPNINRSFAEKLNLRPNQRSLGLLTCDIDDSLYVAIDEGTKAANVEVVYAKSFYAGSGHASGPLSGEIIAIFAGDSPEDVRAAMNTAIDYAENEAWFYTADESGENTFFAHTLSSTGSYLSKEAGINQGEALAYLIACPMEATIGLNRLRKRTLQADC